MAVALLAVPALFAVELTTSFGLPRSSGGWLRMATPFVFVVPPAFAMGLVVPWMVRALAVDPAFTPRQAVWLYAVNTVGGILGIGFVLILAGPRLGLFGAAVGVIALNLTAALGARVLGAVQFRANALIGSWRPRGASCLVGTTLLLILLMAAASFTRRLPSVGLGPGERLVTVAAGREGVVATLDAGAGDRRMLLNNTYTLGGAKAQFNQERQGLLPLLLHGQPRRVATLGVATGSTVGGVSLHPDVEHIQAVELSPLVLKQARESFGRYNREVFSDPRVRFTAEDARWIMAARPAAYDVVIGDLFLPWRTGEGRLFRPNCPSSDSSGGGNCGRSSGLVWKPAAPGSASVGRPVIPSCVTSRESP